MYHHHHRRRHYCHYHFDYKYTCSGGSRKTRGGGGGWIGLRTKVNKKCRYSILSVILSVTSCLIYFAKNDKCRLVERLQIIRKIH